MKASPEIRAVIKVIQQSEYTYANGDGDLTIYGDDLQDFAVQVYRAANGRECTCGIQQYGPGLEHHETCPRWEAS